MLDTYTTAEEGVQARQWQLKIFGVLIMVLESAGIAFLNVLAWTMLGIARYLVPLLANNYDRPRMELASIPAPTRKAVLWRLAVCGSLCLGMLFFLEDDDKYAYLALSCWFSITPIVCSLGAVAFARLIRLAGTSLGWIWRTYHDEIVMGVLWTAVTFQRVSIQLSYNVRLMAAASQHYVIRLWIFAQWLWAWYNYLVMRARI